jgi:predicted DNA-binding transcriptional regulator
MESNEISQQEVAFYLTLKSAPGSLSNREIAKAVKVAERTAQSHTKHFVEAGICEVSKVHGGYRFRTVEPDKPNAHYAQCLADAAEVLGARRNR